jgi:3-oxoadipate enol-lactonase
MAYALRDGARIYWTALGKGDPLVLIMGLGCSSAMWFRMAPLLARRHRVILLDNRGAGRTEKSHFIVHSVAAMAEDVGAVLDAAGVESAHVAGFSMGGMIAQQFALMHPRRVRSLALLATHCGRPFAVMAEDDVVRLLLAKGDLTAEQALEAMRPFTYAARTPQSLIEEDSLVRLAHYPDRRNYQAQLFGIMAWTSWHALPALACPALVLHGLEDRLIPPENARLLAQRIPQARLVELDHASHWLMTDQLERSLGALFDFLAPFRRSRAARG